MSDEEVYVKGEGGFQFVDVDTLLTPEMTDRYLKLLHNEITRAGLAVVKARDEETSALLVYGRARNPLLLDPNCPEVGSGAGRVSAKERDLWVSVRIPDQYEALEIAKVSRANAVDYAWQVKAQAGLMQSLNNNAKTGYETFRGGR